ncbi:ParB/RepB/Spo0J family partition protein [Humitalea sp. 24SJ18S-53]|uniref:ParB/RepB/Spo0J family partition protein n=1 Tax=Humitalea sp. 24SJ18S-53 TaxID=3422307 RepID=UPI003D66F6BF
MEILAIPLDRILVGDRLRSIDGASVDLIAASFAERGQDTPITVGGIDFDDDGAPHDADLYPLIAGAHRVAAARMLGWETIEARVFAGSQDEASLLEIDENLMRRELGALDRAVFLARRKEVYERLFPEARNGRASKSRKVATLIGTPGFSKETAKKLGLDKATIFRSLARAAIPAEMRARLAGHPVADSGAQLDALLRLPDDLRAEVVDALTRTDKPARNVAAAVAEIRHLPPRDPEDVQFERLAQIWARTTSARAKRRFLENIGAIIPAKAAA